MTKIYVKITAIHSLKLLNKIQVPFTYQQKLNQSKRDLYRHTFMHFSPRTVLIHRTASFANIKLYLLPLLQLIELQSIHQYILSN